VHGLDSLYAHPRAVAEGYPDLGVFRSPYNTATSGIPDCEGMVPPYGLDINPRLALFGGQLDTLYFYVSNARAQLGPPNASYLDDAACAFRYAGPGQGRLMMFGFPFYFFPPDKVDGMMLASIRWLLAN